MQLPKSLRQVGEDNAEVVAPPPLFFLVPALLLAALDLAFPTRLAEAPWRWIAASGFIVAGFALQGWAWTVMRRAGTTPLPARPTTAIVEDGPYRFSRNPMYVAFAIVTIGLAFLFDSRWTLFAVPIGVAAITWGVIEREERYLDRKFGASYVDYKRRVRRWL